MDKCYFLKAQYQDRVVLNPEKIEKKYNPNKEFFRELIYNSKGECVCTRIVSYNGNVIFENGDKRNYSHWRIVKLSCDLKDKKEFLTITKVKTLMSSRYFMDIFDGKSLPLSLSEEANYFLYDENKKIVKILEITTNDTRA